MREREGGASRVTVKRRRDHIDIVLHTWDRRKMGICNILPETSTRASRAGRERSDGRKGKFSRGKGDLSGKAREGSNPFPEHFICITYRIIVLFKSLLP